MKIEPKDKLENEYLAKIINLEGFKLVDVNGMNEYFFVKEENNMKIEMRFGIRGLTIYSYCTLGDKFMKIIHPTFKIYIILQLNFSKESLSAELYRLMFEQYQEMCSGIRKKEPKFDIPDILIKDFKENFYSHFFPTVSNLLDMHKAYKVYESRYSQEMQPALFTSDLKQRLVFKALVHSPDYHFFKGLFLNHYELFPKFHKVTKEIIDFFISSLDAHYDSNQDLANEYSTAKGLYALSNEQVMDYFVGEIEGTKTKYRNGLESIMTKPETERSHDEIYFLNNVARYMEDENLLIKKLNDLRLDVLGNPDFDNEEYYKKYNNERPYENAIFELWRMRIIRRALAKTEEQFKYDKKRSSINICFSSYLKVEASNDSNRVHKNLIKIGTTSIGFLNGNGIITDKINDKFREFRKIPYIAYERNLFSGKLLLSASFYYFQHAYFNEKNWVNDYGALYRQIVKNYNIGFSTSVPLYNRILLKPGLFINHRTGSEIYYLAQNKFELITTGQTYNSFGIGPELDLECKLYKHIYFNSSIGYSHYFEKKQYLGRMTKKENSFYQPNRNLLVIHLALGYKL